MLVASEAALCGQLLALNITSCAWSSYLAAHPALRRRAGGRGSALHLWALRWHTAARLVELGYNVLLADADVAFAVDPYPLFRSSFAHAAVLAMREDNTRYMLNAGLVYVQHAQPGGAARWVVAETARRIARVLDMGTPADAAAAAADPSWAWLLTALPFNRSKFADHRTRVAHLWASMLWDQGVLNDVVESACSGREVYRHMLVGVVAQDAGAWFEAAGSARWRSEPDTLFPTGLLAEPAEPLRDVLSCVLSLPGTSTHPSPEVLVAAPTWLFGGWRHGEGVQQGRHGFWNARPPSVAVAHVLGVQHKQLVLRALGWWDARVDAALTPPGNSLKLMTLPPLRTSTLAEYQAQARRLALLALLTNRTAVWPIVVCASAWIGHVSNAQWWHGLQPPEDAAGPVVLVGACPDGAPPPCCYFVPPHADACATVLMHPSELPRRLPACERSLSGGKLMAAAQLACDADAVIVHIASGGLLPDVSEMLAQAAVRALDRCPLLAERKLGVSITQ
jgi:hypothetical protein